MATCSDCQTFLNQTTVLKMDEAILARLQCPITRTPLVLIDDATLKQVNQAIANQSLKTSDDDPVENPIDGGLVNRDRTWLYPIRNGIPSLLIDEAIDLLSLPTSESEEE